MKVNQVATLVLLLGIFLLAWSIGCGDDDDDDDDDSATGTGTLTFLANGEDFIRDGFVGKTGWSIDFEHFYVNLAGLTAYQVAEDTTTSALVNPAHAGHPHNDIPEGSAHIALTGTYWLDLTEGTEPLAVDSAEAPVGNYNYAAWNMIQTTDGEYPGYSIVMVGTATKDEQTIAFTIKLDEQMTFSGCHQETDDEYAGVVEKGGEGTMETTYHSDHLFGDWESLDDPDGVNPGAVGFQPFADLAEDGAIVIDQAEMAEKFSSDDYTTFIAALRTLGHSGEGHCDFSEYSAE